MFIYIHFRMVPCPWICMVEKFKMAETHTEIIRDTKMATLQVEGLD